MNNLRKFRALNDAKRLELIRDILFERSYAFSFRALISQRDRAAELREQAAVLSAAGSIFESMIAIGIESQRRKGGGFPSWLIDLSNQAFASFRQSLIGDGEKDDQGRNDDGGDC